MILATSDKLILNAEEEIKNDGKEKKGAPVEIESRKHLAELGGQKISKKFLDFEIVRAEYLVLKMSDRKLLFIPLMDPDLKVHEVKLKLNKGTITEIVQTERDPIV